MNKLRLTLSMRPEVKRDVGSLRTAPVLFKSRRAWLQA